MSKTSNWKARYVFHIFFLETPECTEIDTKQTQLLIQQGNNFLACTRDVTIVWRRIFMDVLKR
jgi:hypothetical protein